MTNKDSKPTEIKDEADLDHVQGAGLHMALTAAPLVILDEDKEKLDLTADDGSATVRPKHPDLIKWKTEQGES